MKTVRSFAIKKGKFQNAIYTSRRSVPNKRLCFPQFRQDEGGERRRKRSLSFARLLQSPAKNLLLARLLR